MKNLPHPSVIRISQSEAMLEAIQAGFFEAYLEKSTVVEMLSTKACPGVQIELAAVGQGHLTFRVRTIGRSTQEMEFVSRSMAIDQAIPFYVEFQSADLQLLLSQPECVGIRFFPGRCQGARPTLVAVGVRSNGFDIEGTGYLRSLRSANTNYA